MEWTVSLDKLDEFANQFWKNGFEANTYAFHGEMGVGKTTTIAALCKALGVKDTISSPTYSIINEYSFGVDGNSRKIYHIDLYRLKDKEEIIQAGVEECIISGEISMVEWPDKAPDIFDENSLHIILEPVDEKTRLIKIVSRAQFAG
ncbi:MAG: tRNA (adenosine(37)-N6)-threonylcarbamoyltransferase complex ATPase subunit type 1 TsaE [Flavisolibacter sp.]|nr:tRNA (adenosine(37)-N6)-threonylcarbamoyltransferase complex ATPase subunit type 1 TsaE [Flavisolibacter sp.]